MKDLMFSGVSFKRAFRQLGPIEGKIVKKKIISQILITEILISLVCGPLFISGGVELIWIPFAFIPPVTLLFIRLNLPDVRIWPFTSVFILFFTVSSSGSIKIGEYESFILSYLLSAVLSFLYIYSGISFLYVYLKVKTKIQKSE